MDHHAEHTDATRLDAVCRQFSNAFGHEPAAVAQAPGRVNLIGEHVDYADGIVLPIGIGRGTMAAAAPTPRGTSSRFCSEGHGEVAVDLEASLAASPQIGPTGGWQNYPLGVIALLREAGVAVPPLDLALTSSLPIGGGLSSSASLTVSVAAAALAVVGSDLDEFGRARAARLCREVEHRFAGVPCGPMDPAIVALAREDHAMRFDCRDKSWLHLPMPNALALVVFDSGVRHRLDSGGYASRLRSVQAAASSIAAPSLRQLLDDCEGSPEKALNRLAAAGLDGPDVRRARHVLTEVARVRAAAALLEAAATDPTTAATLGPEFGRILEAGHHSLREDFEVSTPELDAIVEFAVAHGAFGARLTGAGFGGCVIAACPQGEAAAVAALVADDFASRFGAPCTWFVSRAAGAAVSQRR